MKAQIVANKINVEQRPGVARMLHGRNNENILHKKESFFPIVAKKVNKKVAKKWTKKSTRKSTKNSMQTNSIARHKST